MPRLHKNVQEVADRVATIGWTFTGENNGKGHPVFRHENGAEYAISATPSEYRSLLNSQVAMERIAGRKIERSGKRRKSHRKFEGSGFSLEVAKTEREAFHQKTDLLPVSDLWGQRRDLIDRIIYLVKSPPSGDNTEEARNLLWKIRATEIGLRNLGQSVRDFDLMDLPIDGATKERAKEVTKKTAPKPDPKVAQIAERAAAKAKKRTAKRDDFDGTALLPETEPWRVELLGKTYDLYLTPQNRAMVQTFLEDLTAGAKVVRKTKPKTKSESARDAALVQARSPEGDDPKEIRAWLRANGFPEIKDRGRFSAAHMKAWENRNARSRREAARRAAAS